jgi:molecular chaperone GrpE
MNDETQQPEAGPVEESDALAAAHKRIDELARAYQAAENDRAAFKLRVQRERERLIEVEKAEVAMVLIEVLDDLDLCLQAPDDSPLAQGVRLIRDQVVKKLEHKKIERLELLGQQYDPQVAEAADMELTADPEEDGRVIAVLRAGYRLKERVIRPARVKIARFAQAAQA